MFQYIAATYARYQVNPFRINSFLFFRLPAAFLCGVRVSHADESRVEVKVTSRWISNNPFGSMYFAVQAMAAELSTGALVMQAIRTSGCPVSMLVTQLSANYHKKATGTITFTCNSGIEIAKAVGDAIHGKPQVLEVFSQAVDANNQLVSEHRITWSLKAR